MAANKHFFGQQSPQAVLKHGILVRYAHYFAGPAGRAAGGRVAFIDGYAGEGRYEDGTHGSPLLIASQQEPLAEIGRSAKLIFIEPDDKRRKKLESSLHDEGVTAARIIGADIEDVIEPLLAEYADHATLLFVDPFGLAFKRDTLERILRLSGPGRPIDVLFHFSLTVKRLATAALSSSSGAAAIQQRIDAALGGIDWRSRFQPGADEGVATEEALKVATEFGQAITHATNVPSISIPVRDRPEHRPLYLLMMFTKYPDALWKFADMASTAHIDWLHYCSEDDYRANMKRIEETGALQLFMDPPSRDDAEGETSKIAERYLEAHIESLVAAHGHIRPISDISMFYGEMLGIARTKHARAAIRTLHKRGVVTDNGAGEFWKRTLRSTA